MNLKRALWGCLAFVELIAAVSFLAQGGFGGGHGRLDPLIYALSLPWALLPWPGAIINHDYFLFLIVPSCMNVAVLAFGTFLLKRLRHAAL